MIGRRTVLVVANLFVGSVLGLVALKITSLYFGPVHVGEVTYAVSLLGLLFFMTDLGMGAAHVKRVSEGRNAGDCFATYAVFKIVTTAIFVLTVVGILVTYAVVLRKPLESTTTPIVLLAMGYYVFKSFSDLGTSSFDARLETAKTQLTQLVETLTRVAFTIVFGVIVGAILWVGSDSTIVRLVRAYPGEALALATAAGGFVAAVVSVGLLRRVLEQGRFRMDLLRDYASFAIPLFLAGALSMVALYIDGAVLGFFGSADDAGIFGTVRRVPAVVGGIGSAVAILFFPVVSSLMARGEREAVFHVADRGLRYLSIVMVPIIGFIVVFAAPLIELSMSDLFLPGTVALQLLAIYVLVWTFCSIYSYLLLGSDKPGLQARLAVASSILLIVLDLVLVPRDIKSIGLRLGGLGVTGAAIATLVSGLAYYAGLRYAARRHLGYRERTGTWKHLLAAAAMLAVLVVVDRTLLPVERWYSFIVHTGIGALVYAASLLALRELTRDDLAFLKETLHPGEMLSYVRGELRHKK